MELGCWLLRKSSAENKDCKCAGLLKEARKGRKACTTALTLYSEPLFFGESESFPCDLLQVRVCSVLWSQAFALLPPRITLRLLSQYFGSPVAWSLFTGRGLLLHPFGMVAERLIRVVALAGRCSRMTEPIPAIARTMPKRGRRSLLVETRTASRRPFGHFFRANALKQADFVLVSCVGNASTAAPLSTVARTH